MPDYRARAALLQREARQDWFRIEDKAAAGAKTARVDIFDEIGFFGTSAKGFVDQITALKVDRIELHINSPGGEVFDSIAIRNTIRDHPAKVTVIVDGVAASSASFIATAGDEVVMNQHSELMVHDAFGLVVGNAADMTDMANRLSQVSDNIASMYAEKAGGTTDAWRAVMRSETWYSAQEAVDVGLADRVAEAEVPSEVKNRFDLSIFNYAGRGQAPPPIENKTPAATASGATEQKEQEMSLVDTLRQRLGIADDSADEATVLKALDEALAERAEPPQPQNSAATEQTPEDLQRLARATGAVIVDKGVWDEAQSKIQQGVDAARKLREQERDHVLDKAVEDGRIPPANKGYWANLYDRDPKGTGDVIASLKKNLVPVQAYGYAGDGDEDDLGEFAHLFPKGA